MVAVAFALLLGPQVGPVPESRFQTVNPLHGLPWIKVDSRQASVGIAQGMARAKGLQGRMLWIDGTANLGAVSTEAKVAALMKRVRDTGFNTVVYDVKPIVGRTLYPSKLAPQMTSWKGQSIPAGYDPLRHIVREGHAQGLSVFVSMNALSEGHSYAKRDVGKPDSQFGEPGWGYEHPEYQTVQMVASPVLVTPRGELTVNQTVDSANPESALAKGVCLFTKRTSALVAGALVVGADGRALGHSRGWPEAPPAGGVILATADPESATKLGSFSVGAKVAMSSAYSFVPAAEAQNQIPLMMNPHDVVIQQRAAQFAAEVAANYEIDGFLYDDRLRFGGLDTDFSPVTQKLFEKYVGKSVRWPYDIFEVTFNHKLERGFRPGKYFDAWMVFRSKTMQSFVSFVRASVKAKRPSCLFGVYAGSWYGDYPKYGANYGSTELNAGFPFLIPAYRRTGFASKLDVLVTGCYYSVATVYEAMERGKPSGRTVEAGGVLSNRVARDSSWVYAGIQLADFWGRPEDLASSLQAAAATTQGVMVFDLSHRIDEVLPLLETAFKRPASAPHQVQGLLEQVRKERARRDRAGWAEPPFPLYEGAPGAGF